MAKAKKRTAKTDDWMTPLRPFEGSGFLQVIRRKCDDKIIDPREPHTLTDREVAVLRRWIQDFRPNKTPLGEVEAILMQQFRMSPADVQQMTWTQIVALLEHNTPPDQWLNVTQAAKRLVEANVVFNLKLEAATTRVSRAADAEKFKVRGDKPN